MDEPKPGDAKRLMWGGIFSLVAAAALAGSSWIYLTGNLGDPLGPFTYSLADLLSGSVWAAGLVIAVTALKERIGQAAPRRMNLAMLLSVAAACGFVAVACIRAANRQYHLVHPDLHLESSTIVLVVWATLVAGMSAAAWHFFGWTWILTGSAGWASGRLPRALSVVFILAGTFFLSLIFFPNIDESARVFAFLVLICQGVFLLRTWLRDNRSRLRDDN